MRSLRQSRAIGPKLYLSGGSPAEALFPALFPAGFEAQYIKRKGEFTNVRLVAVDAPSFSASDTYRFAVLSAPPRAFSPSPAQKLAVSVMWKPIFSHGGEHAVFR